jgi:hypothetical protein
VAANGTRKWLLIRQQPFVDLKAVLEPLYDHLIYDTHRKKKIVPI